MSIATAPTFESYVETLAKHSPSEALRIAISETEKQKAIAAQKAEEYRSMAEISFDATGRITGASMAGMWRLAQIYAGSKLVPTHYQNKPHDCFIAVQMAMRLKIDPFAYMQSSYVVSGRPGIESKLGIAMLNMSGAIDGRVRYRFEGTNGDRKCTAVAIDAGTKEEVSASVDWAMVVAEGWNKNKGTQTSKWMTMPDVMFRYRSAIFLIRAYFPEVLMGIQFADELEDIETSRAPVASDSARTARTLDDMTRLMQEKTEAAEHEPESEAAGEQQGEAESDESPGQSESSADPTVEAFEKYKFEIAQNQVVGNLTLIYDRWFGPDSPVRFSSELDQEACKIRDARAAELRAARTNKK